MEKNKLFSIGTITKKDWVILNDRVNEPTALVLISEHPYSGYYGTTVPDKKEPESMYLVTYQDYTDDQIIRSIQAVKTHFEYSFDAVPGTIGFLNKNLGVIRITCVSYEHIPLLIEAFRQEGIAFMQHRNLPHFEGIIRVTKYFKTEEADKGIYIDLENPNFAYLRIDKVMTWDTFEKIYRDVRNNITEFSFDAAMATMYDESGIIDFVRIYDEKRSLEKLRVIYKKFRDIMARY
jgi:hypothetical protein